MKRQKVHRYYYPFGLETTSCIGRIEDIKSFSINFFSTSGAQEYGEAAAYIQAQFEAKNKSTAKGNKYALK